MITDKNKHNDTERCTIKNKQKNETLHESVINNKIRKILINKHKLDYFIDKTIKSAKYTL